jgi:hypothetical protein
MQRSAIGNRFDLIDHTIDRTEGPTGDAVGERHRDAEQQRRHDEHRRDQFARGEADRRRRQPDKHAIVIVFRERYFARHHQQDVIADRDL